ncbi:MAG: hypothetical protein KHZ10_07350 [Clostridium sp.]|nr:hypothetical protein [Clostridium sp.]
MNYIAQINAFWDSATTNPLSTGQVSLYFALLHVCNRSNWTEWFAAPNQVLSVLTGLSRSGILKARNELKQRGLIDFQEKATKATKYKVTMANSKQVSTQIGVQDGMQIGVQDGTQISDTLYKHKQNEKSSTDVLPEKTDAFSDQITTIRELYNSVCGSYPRLVKMSEARKKAIRARLRAGYTVEDFQKLFEMAEASDFLKGKNNRNWSATFDWLVADSNMAKVLDGNYTNRESAKECDGDADRRPAADFYKQFMPGGSNREDGPAIRTGTGAVSPGDV